MKGNLIAMAYIIVGWGTKAALEAGYFKDRKSAKRTLFLLLVSVGSNGFALCFSFLIDYLG